jgi:hypothetical protein
MAETRVRYQATPNPNAGKFTVDRPVLEGTASKTFHSEADASANPVALALFRIEGVSSLFIVDDFITVTKTASADWTELVPRVVAAIEQTLG